MDDTELGRPPRHERSKKRSEPKTMAGILDRGDGEVVKIDARRTCTAPGCGRKVFVKAEGPEDSMRVRVARMQLDAAELLCEKCGDEREKQDAFAEEQEAILGRMRMRLDRSGIPERWRTLTLGRLEEDDERAEAFAAARQWATGVRRRGVLLYGAVGRGKTVIAAAAAVERCALGHLRWLSVADLLLNLRMPFDSAEYVAAMRKLSPAGRPALVLDDLDKLKPTEHALQPVYVAVNGWIEAGLPMMVTLNRDIDSLAEWAGETFGDALASRLSGYCEVVEVRGRDRRLS